MSRCRHDCATPYVIEYGEFRPLFDAVNPPDFTDINTREYGGRLVAMKCWDCMNWLPLGPANDTPEVLVEVRAAELAQMSKPQRFSPTIDGGLNSAEVSGWDAHLLGTAYLGHADTAGFDAGYLARAIANHDKEQTP